MNTLLSENRPQVFGPLWGGTARSSSSAQRSLIKAIVVDGDPILRAATSQYLEQAGFEVRQAETRRDLYAELDRFAPDLVVLDIELPDRRGLQTCLELRNCCDAAIVVITSRGNMQEGVIGIETGADDHLIKPYSARELLARARAILRRRGVPRAVNPAASLEPLACYRFASLSLSTSRRELRTDDNREILLTGGEYRILTTLLAARGKVVQSAALAREPGASRNLLSNSIASCVYHLRQKLLRFEPDRTIIGSVRSIGYVIKVRIDVTYE